MSPIQNTKSTCSKLLHYRTSVQSHVRDTFPSRDDNKKVKLPILNTNPIFTVGLIK